MSELLRDLGDRLKVGPAMSLVADMLVDEHEPYELGLALSVWERGSGVLLSYNPRTRGTGARGRMQRALQQRGLPVEPVRTAMGWVPDERCSTVIGMEWHAGAAAPGATVYFEEVSRYHDERSIPRTANRLGGLAGLGMMRADRDPGRPYIWALDLDRRGVTAFKSYRWCQDRDAVLAAVQDCVGLPVGEPFASVLGAGEEPTGFILQRRHRPGGGRPPLKVYKTYGYEAGGGREAAAWEVAGVVAHLDRGGLLPLVEAGLGGRSEAPLTSVGMRLAERKEAPVAVTAYWCLHRGPGPLR